MLWAICINKKAVELCNTTINNIRWDPLTIYGWTDKALMNSWSFIFPLTEVSKRDRCLPLTHPAWHNTPNLWWRFTLDRPLLLPPPEQRTSRTSRICLQSSLSETQLDLLENALAQVEICQRKFLTGEITGVLIQGILPQLKLIQTLMEIESFTLGDSYVSNPNEFSRACHYSGTRSGDT